MAIVPQQSTLLDRSRLALSLEEYAYVIEVDECSFFGVKKTIYADDEDQCRTIWTKDQRDMVARHLLEAQQAIEDYVGFFLKPTYVVGTFAESPNNDERFVDTQGYGYRAVTRWGRVLTIGVKSEATIQAGQAVTHESGGNIIDPVVISGITVPSGTVASEIRVYHPGTTVEINPSAISISGTTMTVTIPRCRMVKAALADNPKAGLEYTDSDNFEETVDITRVTTDGSTNATLVSNCTCGLLCTGTCEASTETACVTILDGRLGILQVQPGRYSDGTWYKRGSTIYCPERVRLYYLSGVTVLSEQMKSAIIRLAHTKMPEELCGCDVYTRLWARDRNVPDILTRERINCPFGMSDGAWEAFKVCGRLKRRKAMVLS